MKMVGMMPVMKKLTVCAFVGLMALQLGCSGEEAVKPAAAEASDDQKAIASLVNGISDKASQAIAGKDYKEFRAMFTKDASPKTSEIANYKEHLISVDGAYDGITVTGSSATVPVTVQKYGTENISNATWKVTKGDGGEWQLSDAKIP